MITTTRVKEWGNSLGVIIPKEIARKEKLKSEDEVIIEIRKKGDIMDLFDTLKFKKSSQQMKDEGRKAWGG